MSHHTRQLRQVIGLYNPLILRKSGSHQLRHSNSVGADPARGADEGDALRLRRGQDGSHMFEKVLGHVPSPAFYRQQSFGSRGMGRRRLDNRLHDLVRLWSVRRLCRTNLVAQSGFRRAPRPGFGRARRRHDGGDFASDRDLFGSCAGCSRPLFATIAPMLPQGERRRDAVAARRDPKRRVARIADVNTADVARIVSDLECADAVALRELVQHRFCKFPAGWFCAATRPRRTLPGGDFFGVFFPTSTKESTTWHNA